MKRRGRGLDEVEDEVEVVGELTEEVEEEENKMKSGSRGSA